METKHRKSCFVGNIYKNGNVCLAPHTHTHTQGICTHVTLTYESEDKNKFQNSSKMI